MSQRCPMCRLYNPATALRCDCGYDFGSGTVQPSFVQAHLEQKHGGRANLLDADAKTNIRNGFLLAALLAATSLGLMVATGRLLVSLPLALWAVILILRGLAERRHARALRRARPAKVRGGPDHC